MYVDHKMTQRIRKVGGSLTLYIPRDIAKYCSITEDSTFELIIVDKTLILKSAIHE